MSSPDRLFQDAHQAYASNDIASARAKLASLRQMFPMHPAVLQLAALTEKKAGDLIAAVALFEKAIPLAPRDAELHANYANTLAALHDPRTIAAYDAAIRLAPDRHEFRLNRAITHLELGAVAAAAQDIDDLAPHQQHSAKYWSVAGQVYRAAGQADRARDAFERALAFEPGRVTALAALGELYLHAGEPAARTLYARALEKAPQDRNLALGLSQALEIEGQFEEAVRVLERAWRAAPDWHEGFSALSRLMIEAGERDRALLLHRERTEADSGNPRVWSDYASFLRAIEAPAEAAAVLESGLAAVPGNADLILLQAGLAIELGEAARADAALQALPAELPAALAARVRYGLRFGEADRAAAATESYLARYPDDIAMWALQSLCWRMTDDPREAWLNPPDTLVRAVDIGFPDDPEPLAQTLRKLHVARHHPAGQSLRHGTQTRGSLFQRREPALVALAEHIARAVDAYWQSLPPDDAHHPLLRHRSRSLAFCGSWSVRLTSAGFHVAHIHPAGLVSSAFYVAIPDSLGGDTKAGWLEAGSAPVELGLPLAPYALIEPKPGRLVLFPSYLFHGTRPFGEGERLTVAFDLTTAA